MKREEFIIRRKKVYQHLNNGEVMVMFAGELLRKTADAKYPFFTNRNFFYLTGVNQERTVLFAQKFNDKISETIFTMMPDEEAEKWNGRRFKADEITAICGIENITDIEKFSDELHISLTSENCHTVYLCLDTQKHDQPMDLEHNYAKMLRKVYPEIVIKNIFSAIVSMRRYKSEEEIEAIRRGIDITNEGIRKMMTTCKPGIMEYQLEAEFNYVLMQHGQRNTAFDSIVASGERNFYLHYSSLMGRVEDGDLVLTDVGAPYDEYSTDISRMFPANGRFTERQAAIYNIAFDASRAVMKAVKPGAPFTICNKVCGETAFEGLKKLGLIDDIKDIKKYVWHNTTHHIGLDTHDVGGYADAMAENMAFVVDAGIYVREWGIGLRIEDDVLVTKDGCEHLSKDIPSTIEEIEALMNKR